MEGLLRTLGSVVGRGQSAAARPPRHRPFSKVDASLLRGVPKDATRAFGKAVPASANPGVRLEPSFVDAAEAERAVAEATELLAALGISHVTEELTARHALQMAHLARPPPPNMLRLTGRDEGAAWIAAAQRRAPWGYGGALDATALPPTLAAIADRIASCEAFALGPLRDVTINQRRHGFFRLDPHLDPSADGANVFILGFESPTVLTVSPANPRGAALMDQRKAALRSWAPGEDVDVLSEPRTLIHLHGPARARLGHGTRLGVSRSQLEQCGVELSSEGEGGEDEEDDDDDDDRNGGVLFDWWGSVHHPIRRNPTRTSLVFAFADVDEEF
jgi:hypothetical protein